ncbi:MAG TPA: hypothetical protein VKJ07_03275, partial [Mycobacteriales bacterium]|nr:hypothetical protein [Mycobacteriales bacterium]
MDEELDEVVDDPVDDVVHEVDDEDEPVVSRRRGGTAIKVKKADSDTDKLTAVRSDERVGI